MDDFVRLITLQDYNTRVVLAGAVLLGFCCGVVGVLGVLRKRALMGDAIAHAALPGVCVGFLIAGGRHLPALLLGALVFGLLAVVCVTLIHRHTRTKEDAAIGITLTTFFGLGLALLTRITGGQSADASRAGLEAFIFGKAAGMVLSDVLIIGGVCAAVLVVVAVLLKEFQSLCFDTPFSRSIGRPTVLLDVVLLTLVAMATVAALPAVGVVLVVALLTIPPAAARFWTDRFTVMLLLSGVIGAGAGAVGTAASALVPKLSAGPVITLCATALFIASMLCAPGRGLFARALRRVRQRRTIALQNLMRALWELGEQNQAPATTESILRKRAWTPGQVASLASRAAGRGWVEAQDAGWRLTPAGHAEGERLTRAHRLWELYLIEHASIAPDHVDRDADVLEHVLPANLIEDLEHRLREEGRMPGVPVSPHALEAARGEVRG